MLKKTTTLYICLFILAAVFQPALAKSLMIHGGNDVVERAGTIIIKRYGPKDYAVLVGEDRHHKFWNFPGGGVDHKDKYTSQTAARETYEETAKVIRYSSRSLSRKPYVYSPRYKIQLFVVRDDSISIRKLNHEVKKINKQRQLPHSFREISAYRAIPLRRIIDAAECVKQTNHPRKSTHSCYFVMSRGNPKKKQPGDVVRLERHYLGAIAQDLANFKAAIAQVAP